MDLGSRGYFGYVFRKHGQQPWSSFTGADRGQDLIRWLLSFGSVYPVHLHGPGAWRLEELIRAAGFLAQREDERPHRVTVSCLRDGYDALAISLYGPVERRSTPATGAGRRDLAGWLRTLGAVSEAVLGDPDDGSAELETDLREQGWPVHVEKLTGASAVFNDCDAGRDEALAARTGLLRGAAEARAVWIEEPGSHRFAFRVRDHGVLSVRIFYLAEDLLGTATPAGEGELVLDATVRLADLAMAFVSASHSLLGAVPDIDVRARWPYGPPLHELREIEALLARNASSRAPYVAWGHCMCAGPRVNGCTAV